MPPAAESAEGPRSARLGYGRAHGREGPRGPTGAHERPAWQAGRAHGGPRGPTSRGGGEERAMRWVRPREGGWERSRRARACRGTPPRHPRCGRGEGQAVPSGRAHEGPRAASLASEEDPRGPTSNRSDAQWWGSPLQRGRGERAHGQRSVTREGPRAEPRRPHEQRFPEAHEQPA